MSVELITLLLFGSLVVLLALGLPFVFALGGVAVIFAFFLWGPQSLYLFAITPFRATTSFILVAAPLFIFMGSMLERSGIADELYETMYRWIGHLRGGLAMGTVGICTLFAAMAGTSSAGTVTMGIVAIPAMLKRNYNKSITLGSVAAGGALGTLIPPSVMMIIYGVIAEESVGRMFMGGLFPGLVFSSLFITYIGMRCYLQPNMGPAVPPEERYRWREKLTSLKGTALPILLVVLVLGSIFLGIATPSEAAGVGAAGSLLVVFIHHKLTWSGLKEATYRSFRITAMVMWILIGAKCLTAVYIGIGAPELITEIVTRLPVSRWMILIGMQLSLFVMGMFLDPVGIIMLSVPIFVPIIKALGFDSLWFAILFICNMEMGFLTPPFGFNLFYLKGIVPKGITMGDIYRSVVFFVILQAVGLIIVMIFPQLVLWLPSMMINR